LRQIQQYIKNGNWWSRHHLSLYSLLWRAGKNHYYEENSCKRRKSWISNRSNVSFKTWRNLQDRGATKNHIPYTEIEQGYRWCVKFQKKDRVNSQRGIIQSNNGAKDWDGKHVWLNSIVCRYKLWGRAIRN
jgi:hypothetical protein